jgi:hypothetical protein
MVDHYYNEVEEKQREERYKKYRSESIEKLTNKLKDDIDTYGIARVLAEILEATGKEYSYPYYLNLKLTDQEKLKYKSYFGKNI